GRPRQRTPRTTHVSRGLRAAESPTLPPPPAGPTLRLCPRLCVPPLHHLSSRRIGVATPLTATPHARPRTRTGPRWPYYRVCLGSGNFGDSGRADYRCDT